MNVQKTVSSRGIKWLVTYDDKSSVEVTWLWGSWCAHFKSMGPRGGVTGMSHVPMETLKDLVYEETAHRFDGGKIPEEGKEIVERYGKG